jgi:hypothetical protein
MFKHPANRAAGVIHDLTKPDKTLTTEEEFKLSELIEKSITERYSGELERHEDERGKMPVMYTPLDTDDIRNVLIKLWGKYVTAETLKGVFNVLTQDGAEHWPNAWCKEDLEYEREQRGREIDRLDTEIEYAESRLATLRQERADSED